MAQQGLGRGSDAERRDFAGEFRQVGGPHLEDRVAEAELENVPGDALKGMRLAEAFLAPFLRLAALVAEGAQGFGLRGAELGRHLGAINFQLPRVGVAGRDALGFQQHGCSGFGLAQQGCVVPGFAGDRFAVWSRAGFDDVRKRGADVGGVESEAERDVANVQAEVAHAAVFAVEGDLPLPIDRLVRVEVAAVVEGGADFENLAELTGFHVVDDALDGGIEREFGRDSDLYLRVRSGNPGDFFCGFEVDSERLFREQVLSGFDDLPVDRQVQVVRHGDVDGVDVAIQQGREVVGGQGDGRHVLLEPFPRGRGRVADGGDDRLRRDTFEVEPPRRRAGELLPHEPTPNHAELESLYRHGASIRWGRFGLRALCFALCLALGGFGWP